MKTLIPLMFLLLSMNANAGFTSVVIAYGTGDTPVKSYLDIDAEYVALSVSLSSDAKYPSQRAKLIHKLQSIISTAAVNDPYIEFQQGVVSLSPREKSSFSFSSSYSGSSGSSFYLLSKLDNKEDVYAAIQRIYEFIEGIKKPEDTNLGFGDTSLAISTPEKYRNQLLTSIMSDIDATRKVFGAKYKVTVSGLENPVIVRQKDDKQVTLFIDYSIQLAE